MSISITYFFNSHHSLPELATQVNDVLGCSLKPVEGAPFPVFTAFPFFGMELDLGVNIRNEIDEYADDGELKFSRYNYELDATTYWGQADVRSVQLPVLLSAIFTLHQRLGLVGMLVFDGLLALYELRTASNGRSELYDTVSQTTFFRFGDHLSAVQKRLPDDFRLLYIQA